MSVSCLNRSRKTSSSNRRAIILFMNNWPLGELKFLLRIISFPIYKNCQKRLLSCELWLLINLSLNLIDVCDIRKVAILLPPAVPKNPIDIRSSTHALGLWVIIRRGRGVARPRRLTPHRSAGRGTWSGRPTCCAAAPRQSQALTPAAAAAAEGRRTPAVWGSGPRWRWTAAPRGP